MTATTHPPATFRLLHWDLISAEEVDPLGPYAETYWLPILHPTAFVLGRRLVTLSRRANVVAGERLELDARTVAHAIGIYDHGEPSPSLGLYARTLKRLARYRLIRVHGATVAVRNAWPRLDSGLLGALSLPMQLAEPDWWANSAVPKAEFVERAR